MHGMIELARFRWWLLAIYIAAGSVLYPLLIAYVSSLPPRREALGDAGYEVAWRTIIFGGACLGPIFYLIPWGLTRLQARLKG